MPVWIGFEPEYRKLMLLAKSVATPCVSGGATVAGSGGIGPTGPGAGSGAFPGVGVGLGVGLGLGVVVGDGLEPAFNVKPTAVERATLPALSVATTRIRYAPSASVLRSDAD